MLSYLNSGCTYAFTKFMQGATWHVNITFVKWNLVGIPLATKKKEEEEEERLFDR
jgi:hypothetical protein